MTTYHTTMGTVDFSEHDDTLLVFIKLAMMSNLLDDYNIQTDEFVKYAGDDAIGSRLVNDLYSLLMKARGRPVAERNPWPIILKLVEDYASPEDAALFKMFWADCGGAA